jgi:hypothetical protein
MFLRLFIRHSCKEITADIVGLARKFQAVRAMPGEGSPLPDVGITFTGSS